MAQKFGVQDAIRMYTRQIKDHFATLGINRNDRIKHQHEGTSKDPQGYAQAFMERFEKGIAGLPPGNPRVIDVPATDEAHSGNEGGTEG